MTELEQAKQYWSTHHFQSTRVIPEGQGQDHRYVLARHIASLKPASVLEFGCNSGRNLLILHALCPPKSGLVKLIGVDMNGESIDAARRLNMHYIDFWKGDESVLDNVESDSIDVVFTCSVLDHIPDPTWKSVYDHMVRIAKRAVVMLEPIYTDGTANQSHIEVYTGDLSQVRSEEFPNGMRVVPFTYSWDYADYDPELRILKRVVIPTDAQDSGDHYWLMERKK